MFNTGIKTIYNSTMRRELKELGFNSCVVTRNSINREINNNNKKDSNFAKEHTNWTVEQWGEIMWYDESDMLFLKTMDALE